MDFEQSKINRGKLSVAQRLEQRIAQQTELESLLKSSTFRHYATTKAAPATAAEYARKMKLLESAGQTPLDYCRERNLGKQMYHALKSALKRDTVQRMIFARRSGDPAQIAAAIERAKAVIAADKTRYEQAPDPTRERRLRESGRESKRKTLRGLPADWRERVSEQLRASKYSDAALVLHQTGCRPSELQKGVEIERTERGFTLLIYGSKQSEINQSGQAKRVLLYAADSAAGKQIEKIMGEGKEKIVKIESCTGFQKIYKAAAEKALGKAGKRLSPYSARHQFSADLKSSGGMSKVEIAAAMGHQSTRSQGQYGMASQGRGGAGGVKAAGTQPVRDQDHGPNRAQVQSPRL